MAYGRAKIAYPIFNRGKEQFTIIGHLWPGGCSRKSAVLIL